MLIKKKTKKVISLNLLTLALFTKHAFFIYLKNRASNTSMFYSFSILCTCNFLNDTLTITFSILFIFFRLFFL